MEHADGRQFETKSILHLVPHIEISDRSMDTDGQVEPARLLIDGEEVRVRQAEARFSGTQVDAAGPVLLPEVDLFDRFVHVVRWSDNWPAESALAHLPDIAHPTVVAPGECEIHLWAWAERPQEERGVEDLDVDAQLVHV